MNSKILNLSPSPRFLAPNSNHSNSRNRGFLVKPRRFSSNVSCSELPLLPFPIDQVLVPSESKTLHLYEARYLSLLEESLFRKKKFFVHFVLDPIVVSDPSDGTSFAARYGCLVVIEKVERLDVGALVSIRGIGRVRLVEFNQADPYLKGVVVPLHDNVPQYVSSISSKIMEVKEALHSLNSLEIKLKAPKEALLQTRIANSLNWAENELSFIDVDEAFVPSFAERVSFAALQPVSGSSQSENMKLQREKLRAMDIKDTLERLENSLEFANQNISIVAAKLAIQSLEDLKTKQILGVGSESGGLYYLDAAPTVVVVTASPALF